MGRCRRVGHSAGRSPCSLRRALRADIPAEGLAPVEGGAVPPRPLTQRLSATLPQERGLSAEQQRLGRRALSDLIGGIGSARQREGTRRTQCPFASHGLFTPATSTGCLSTVTNSTSGCRMHPRPRPRRRPLKRPFGSQSLLPSSRRRRRAHYFHVASGGTRGSTSLSSPSGTVT